jgi:hypothetical protein
VTGSVEVVGFGQVFRPGAWTQLVVRLRPDVGTPSGTYRIIVEQEDLDRDLVSYVREVTLTGGGGGGGGGGGASADQRFVVTFLPQGTNNQDGFGLPDQGQSSRLDQLQRQLRVYLADGQGRRLMQLPVTSMIASLDAIDARRGVKLVLYVKEAGAQTSPAQAELSGRSVVLGGVNEDIGFVEVTPRQLPSTALAYQGVDAVVWAAGGPPDRAVAAEAGKFRALREWVGSGGRLVVMQHAEWRRTAAWGELLPVELVRSRDAEATPIVRSRDLSPLLGIVGKFDSPADLAAWRSLTAEEGREIGYGRGKARAGATVEIAWTPAEGSEELVYLARHGVGAGVVTYVAPDLGAGGLSTAKAPPGWATIWARVLDYRYEPTPLLPALDGRLKAALEPSRASLEFGAMVLRRMEQTGRAGALVGISILFFVLYWLAAGPGSWIALRLRGKKQWSWWAYAAVAAAGTLVTLGTVRLVLRGGPEVRHFSLVRIMPGEPVLVESRVGLYIPRDGDQQIELTGVDKESASALSAYAIHPRHARDVEGFPSYRRYEVGTADVSGAGTVGIGVPFRSTAKRMQFVWRGAMTEKTTGSPVGIGGQAVVPAISTSGAFLSGALTNNTGTDLRGVLFVHRTNVGVNAGQDVIVHMPFWKDGAQVTLESMTSRWTSPQFGGKRGGDGNQTFTLDWGGSVWGLLGRPGGTAFEWDNWIRERVRGGSMMLADVAFDDAVEAPLSRGWVVLSLFDRLPFYRNVEAIPRADMLRVNARFLDVSSAVSAGRLVVIAQGAAEAPLPVPLRVEGEAAAGSGVVLYQVVLPLDRSRESTWSQDAGSEAPPTTLPATGPATGGTPSVSPQPTPGR